jgi:hypothetical protein
MATIALQPVLPVQTPGPEEYVMEFPEAASQTFKKGYPVYLAATGITICAANPAKILGFAADDAHNDGSAGLHNIGVYIAHPSTIFAGNIVVSGNANGNNVAPTKAVLAQAQLGLSYGLNLDATNMIATVDTSDTGSSKERVVPFAPLNAYGQGDPSEGGMGDTGARVLFTVMPAYSQLYMLSS